MAKVIIIGAGGVGTVVAHKCAQNPDVFTEIVLASRTKSKCDAIAKAIGKPNIVTDRVDADNVDDLVTLFRRHNPELVINVALPYQDLTIMDACLDAVSTILTLPIMSLKMKPILNIHGSGPIANVLKRRVDRDFGVRI